MKRRCSAQNCISLIEHARNRSLMARHGLNKVIGKPTEMPDMKRARDAASAPAPALPPTHLYLRIYRIVYSI